MYQGAQYAGHALSGELGYDLKHKPFCKLRKTKLLTARSGIEMLAQNIMADGQKPPAPELAKAEQMNCLKRA